MVVNYLKPKILDEKRFNFLAMKQFPRFCAKPFWTHEIFKISFLMINQDFFSRLRLEILFCVKSVKIAFSVFAKWLQRSATLVHILTKNLYLSGWAVSRDLRVSPQTMGGTELELSFYCSFKKKLKEK